MKDDDMDGLCHALAHRERRRMLDLVQSLLGPGSLQSGGSVVHVRGGWARPEGPPTVIAS